MALNVDHPCLIWMRGLAQFDSEDQRSFVALVERYEAAKDGDRLVALGLLEDIKVWFGGCPDVACGWYWQQRGRLGSVPPELTPFV